jgi:hypothetical protein
LKENFSIRKFIRIHAAVDEMEVNRFIFIDSRFGIVGVITLLQASHKVTVGMPEAAVVQTILGRKYIYIIIYKRFRILYI